MALTKKQLIARKQGIGGSDAAAILGLSQWKTPLDVFFDKLDTAEPNDDIISPFMEWGNRLESAIVQKFQEEMGVECKVTDETFKHPDYPFMLANIDALLPSENAILECKTTSVHAKDKWGLPMTDDIPKDYLIQCAHYAEVLNVAKVYIAVLIGGNEFRIYKYDRSARLGNALIQKEHDFWHNNVLNKIPPAPINSADAAKLWLESVREGSVVPTSELYDTIEIMKGIKAQIKKLESEYDKHSQQIFETLQEKDRLIDYQGNTLATWSVQNTCRFDTNSFKKEHPDLYKNYIKTTKSRILRLK